jgi:hypothetical protein
MINVQPGFQFEAVLDSGTSGKVGVYGTTLNDNVGGVVWPFDTTGIIEMALGVYAVTKVAPNVPGQYSIIWLDAPGGNVLGVEDLIVGTVPQVPIGPPPSAPVVGGMTFKQLQDECVVFRFGENRRDSVKLWINRRMQAVWSEGEWAFMRVNRADVITGWDGNPIMPTGFRRAITLEDGNGNLIEYMDTETFRNNFPTNSQGSGIPSAFTTWNGQILFDTSPGTDVNFKLSYLRRICVFDSTGNLREGLMVDDGDKPLWDPEHHFLLVLGASSTGLKLENDFTWNSLEDEFQMALTDEG